MVENNLTGNIEKHEAGKRALGSCYGLKIVIILSVFSILSKTPTEAQRGGESIYGILNVVQSARIASLGGNQVGLEGNDLSMLMHNPAILNPKLSRHVSLSYVPFMAGINYGFGGFANEFKGIGTFALSFHHVGYGSFTAADESGLVSGTFSAGETVIQLTYSRPLHPNWNAGISAKPVFSRIESYHSWGIALDAGLFYRHPGGLLTGGLALRNLGQQVVPYYGGQGEPILPDLQIGLSQRLEHAPFRFSLTVQDLLSGSLEYNLPEQGNQVQSTISPENESNLAGEIFKHFTLGMEFLPSRNFYVAVGLNPRRRDELNIPNRMSTVGYTWGFGFKAFGFYFSYGSARYHLGGTSNHFSITTNLSSF